MKLVMKNESGMALLVVLAVISVLLAAALQLARTAGESAVTTGEAANRFLGREQAMAGIHLAMALLAEDGSASDIDSVQEDWARPEELARAIEAMGYDKQQMGLEITDELGKLQVNALIKQYPGREVNADQVKIWERFFETLNPGQDPVEIINCLIDWLDHRDDEAVTGLTGAESDHYLSLDIPYSCANGPFTHISEIFLVKGITEELFMPDPEEDDEEAEPVVPAEVITVHGLPADAAPQGKYGYTGKVNINTAPEEVIRALLPLSAQDQAAELVAFREEGADDDGVFTNTLDKGWVSQVIELSDKEKQAFERSIRYESDLFRVKSWRSTGNSARTGVSALIHREKNETSGKWSCRILQLTKEY